MDTAGYACQAVGFVQQLLFYIRGSLRGPLKQGITNTEITMYAKNVM
jgi:hypothetical protein